ncbi:MAG: hypothetical protein AB7G11_14000 [Phycisphaerales bacterium]
MPALEKIDLTNEQIQRKIDQLTTERRECQTKARKILAKATVEDRELTPEESREADSLMDGADRLSEKIAKHQKTLSGETPPGKGGIISAPGPEDRAYQPGEYRALAKDESFREHLIGTGEIEERRGRPLSLGRRSSASSRGSGRTPTSNAAPCPGRTTRRAGTCSTPNSPPRGSTAPAPRR